MSMAQRHHRRLVALTDNELIVEHGKIKMVRNNNVISSRLPRDVLIKNIITANVGRGAAREFYENEIS